jgi:hypothetical protein
MPNRSLKAVPAIFAALVVASISTAQEIPESLDASKYALSTSEIAIAKAFQYTGFDRIDRPGRRAEATAEIMTAGDENSPYVADEMSGKYVWNVHFGDIPVEWGTRVIGNRNFDVILDAETGQLIKIFSIDDNAGSSDTLPQPTARGAEMNLGRRGYTFNSLPNQCPTVPFMQALNSVIIGNPLSTKILKAYYWDITNRGGPRPRTWIIILRGMKSPMPSSAPGGENIHPKYRNAFMTIINSDNGVPEYSSTAPQDDSDYEIKKGTIK